MECTMRDSGLALLALVRCTRCFSHHSLHHLHPLEGRGLGLMRQPDLLDQDACRRSGQKTDAGIWPARHVCAGRVANVTHAYGNEA